MQEEEEEEEEGYVPTFWHVPNSTVAVIYSISLTTHLLGDRVL